MLFFEFHGKFYARLSQVEVFEKSLLSNRVEVSLL